MLRNIKVLRNRYKERGEIYEKKSFFVFFTFIILTFFNIVSASSFDISISPDKVTSKKGETVCIFVNDVKQNDIKIKFNYKLNIKLNI